MKIVIYITLLVTSVISLSSCRGSGGKKVATEALEFIEKEAGSLERNTGRLERDSACLGSWVLDLWEKINYN